MSYGPVEFVDVLIIDLHTTFTLIAQCSVSYRYREEN
jgi:hypothetical protein